MAISHWSGSQSPSGFPGRTVLAYLSGILMLFGGIGLLFNATVALSIRTLFPYLILWTLLKVPALFVAPQIEGVWLGIGELNVLLIGGWILFARLAALREDQFWPLLPAKAVSALRVSTLPSPCSPSDSPISSTPKRPSH